MIAQSKVLAVLDNFMHKARKVNKPYQAVKKTDDFKTLQTTFTDGITTQGKWVASELSKLLESAGIADDLQPISIDQQQKLTGLIKRDMPTLAELVSEFTVFQTLKSMFEWAALQQYKGWGYLVKADRVNFDLTNVQYINQLKARAAYLLNQSSLDETTLDDIISVISDNKLLGMTNDEVAQMLKDSFDEVSASRGEMIARTESANALGSANYATMVENGAQLKSWVVAGPGCDQCDPNADDGEIPVNEAFSSGDLYEPAHPNCECYTEASEIDLDSIDIWGGE